MNEIELDKIIEKVTLNVFHIGSNDINFYIIKTLPSDVERIMKETGLTKVPINRRLNEMEKYGLLKREKWTGKVYPTKLTELFKSLINEIRNQVKNNVPEMLPNLID